MDISLEHKIEALLFYAAEPLSVTELADLTSTSVAAVEKAIGSLEESLQGHALVVARDKKNVALVTHADVSPSIEQFAKRASETPLSPAASEVLAIIAYTEGVTKPEIDFIRGVNSQYTLRSLMMRGLIIKDGSQGVVRYHGTTELLAFLGITSWRDLPQKEELLQTYQSLINAHEAETRVNNGLE